MAAGGGTQPGRFHLKCSADVKLNTHRTTAWTKTSNDFGIAYSRDPISKGKFCVKVLSPGYAPNRYAPVSRPLDVQPIKVKSNIKNQSTLCGLFVKGLSS